MTAKGTPKARKEVEAHDGKGEVGGTLAAAEGTPAQVAQVIPLATDKVPIRRKVWDAMEVLFCSDVQGTIDNGEFKRIGAALGLDYQPSPGGGSSATFKRTEACVVPRPTGVGGFHTNKVNVHDAHGQKSIDPGTMSNWRASMLTLGFDWESITRYYKRRDDDEDGEEDVTMGGV